MKSRKIERKPREIQPFLLCTGLFSAGNKKF